MKKIYDPMQLAMFTQILKEAKEIPREEPKPRKRLQFIGTEGARNRISQTTWIDLAIMEAAEVENAVLDDVRFVNEFNAFKNAGWKSILLHCSRHVQVERLRKLYPGYDPASLNHASELDIDNIRKLDQHDFYLDTSYITDEENHRIIERLITAWSSE